MKGLHNGKGGNAKIIRNLLFKMFGMNEEGKTFSVKAINFKPFFYVKVSENNKWAESDKVRFHNQILSAIGKDYYAQSIYKSELLEKKTLYGF